MSVGKKITIIIFAIISALMVGVDGWYLYVYLFKPDLFVSHTVEVDLQTTSDGGTTLPFVEINYMSNKNKNGYETFEIKFNYFMDEDQDNFISQGLQYVANATTGNIEFQYQRDMAYADKAQPEFHKNGWYHIQDYFARFGTFVANPSTTNTYNYMSSDNYEHVFMSTNPLDNDSRFKIQIGAPENKETLIMQFRGEIPYEESDLIYTEQGANSFYLVFNVDNYYHYYVYSDVNYFAKLLYDSLQNVSAGTNTYAVFEFGDMFDYYTQTDTDGRYEKIESQETAKVIQDVTSYYKIKINVSADGARSAKDSIFNCLNGSQNYNSGAVQQDDYFFGRTILQVTNNDFTYIDLGENNYALKLKDDFIKYYSQYPELQLSVHIDLDKLKAENITFFGLANDNGLDRFRVLEIYTTETIEGRIVRTEVEYA